MTPYTKKLFIFSFISTLTFIPALLFLNLISKDPLVVYKIDLQSIFLLVIFFASSLVYIAFNSVLVFGVLKLKDFFIPIFLLLFEYFLMFVINQDFGFELLFINLILLSIGLAIFLVPSFFLKKSLIKPNFKIATSRYSKNWLLVLSLVLSTSFYYPVYTSLKNKNFDIPKNDIEKQIQPILNIILKNIESSIYPKSEDVSKIISNMYPKNNMSIEQKELDLIIKNLGQKPSQINIQERVIDYIHNALNLYSKYLPLVFSLAVFLTIQSIFTVISFLAIPIALLIYKVLLKINFLEEFEESVTIKQVKFKSFG